MSDRVAVFNEGVIQQIDQVDRLYETPGQPFLSPASWATTRCSMRA